MTTDSMTKPTNILAVENKIYKDCTFCKKQTHETLEIPYHIYAEWLYIMHMVGEKEWGGVFTVKDGVVTGYSVPPQYVTSVEVEFLEECGGNGIVHSHHSMKAYHSAQDDAQVRNMSEYSIVLSFASYDACRKVQLPCGGYSYVAVDLVIVDVPVTKLEEVIMDKPVVKYTPPANGYTGSFPTAAERQALIDSYVENYTGESEKPKIIGAVTNEERAMFDKRQEQVKRALKICSECKKPDTACLYCAVDNVFRQQ